MRCAQVVVRIFVRDWPRAVALDRDVLGIPVAFESEELGWAQLDTGAHRGSVAWRSHHRAL